MLASVFSFLRSLAPMRGPAGAFRENRMFEPVIGLIVAVLLGAYLAYTLLHPEKF
jgi:K+-transporting ATPase KdpF subunit